MHNNKIVIGFGSVKSVGCFKEKQEHVRKTLTYMFNTLCSLFQQMKSVNPRLFIEAFWLQLKESVRIKTSLKVDMTHF